MRKELRKISSALEQTLKTDSWTQTSYTLLLAYPQKLIIGIVAGKFIFAKDTRKQIEEAEIQSQSIVREAGIRAETILQGERVGGKGRSLCKCRQSTIGKHLTETER